MEFFSLCYRNPYRVSQLGSFVLGNSVMLGQPVSPTSEIFRIHRPPYRDYKGLHGLIRVTGDTGITTLGYKVTRLNKVYLYVYRAYVRVYMGV